MKSTLLTLAIAFSVFFPAATFAASVSLSPTAVSLTPGKVFTVRVMAIPNGAKVYTVRANLSFDPSLVKVKGFKFEPKWLALSTGGYDLIDNTSGKLIKTAGYPGGITSPTFLGMVTFVAKSTGTAHISVTAKSLLLNENSKNTISGTQGVTQVVVLVPKLVAPKHKPKYIKKVVANPTVKNKKVVAASSVKTAQTGAANSTATSTATSTVAASQVAAIAGAGFDMGSVEDILLIVLLFGLIAGGFWYYRRKSN